MGRVSDALGRARIEVKSPVSQAKDEPPRPVGELTAGHSHANAKGHSAHGQKPLTAQTDGEHKSQPGRTIADVLPQPANSQEQRLPGLPHAKEKAQRGLRQRFDNLLLGRARDYLKSYPLPALDQGSAAGEQYKILREQIKKITGERNTYILAVTSPIKGDGKSTVAANLAAAIVLNQEERVLLIDGDFRSPSLHEIFGIDSAPGLVEYLNANSGTDLMSYVRATSLSGLRILPAGKPPAHSSELLGSEKMKALVRELPVRFPGYLVIVDAPPVLSTSDSFVLAQLVDGIVMVIRSGKTPRGCVTDALKLLGSNKVIGVILNGAELRATSKYYYASSSL